MKARGACARGKGAVDCRSDLSRLGFSQRDQLNRNGAGIRFRTSARGRGLQHVCRKQHRSARPMAVIALLGATLLAGSAFAQATTPAATPAKPAAAATKATPAPAKPAAA